MSETGLILHCKGARLAGVLNRPDSADRQAVVFVVGGPQYRIGSHRLHVALARKLAENGIASLRFDYRGVGDSEGRHPGFEAIEPDIAVAVDAMAAAGAEHVVLFGLCDAVPPICAYAALDSRIRAIVILNPWVREAASHETVMLRRYYAQRLLQADFWRNLIRGRAHLRDFAQTAARALRRRMSGKATAPAALAENRLLDRILSGLTGFEGAVLLIMSGRDLTAEEFQQEAGPNAHWQAIAARPGFARLDVAVAYHTFSEGQTTAQLAQVLADWLRRDGAPPPT